MSQDLLETLAELEPGLLFVDENGWDADWLEQVLAVRREGHHFDLVVTAWPSNEDALRSILGAGVAARRLEGLRRRDILEILGRLGILEDEWLGLLADQAGNRPGLAVVLAQFAKSSNWQDAVDGKAVMRELRLPLRRLLGSADSQACQLLAILALGGPHGMDRKKAAALLGVIETNAAGLFRNIESTGILIEIGRGQENVRLAIEPEILRYAWLPRPFSRAPPGRGVASLRRAGACGEQ